MLSKPLLKKMHVLTLVENVAEHSIFIKFDFGVEKTYNLLPETFETLVNNKEKLKDFVSHSSKYEIQKHIEVVYQLI